MKPLLGVFQAVTLSAVVQARFCTVFQTTRPRKEPVSCALAKLSNEDLRLLRAHSTKNLSRAVSHKKKKGIILSHETKGLFETRPMMPLSPNETVRQPIELDVHTRTPFPAIPAVKCRRLQQFSYWGAPFSKISRQACQTQGGAAMYRTFFPPKKYLL